MLSSRLIPFHSVTSKSPQASAFALLRIYRPEYPKPGLYHSTRSVPIKAATVFRENTSRLAPAIHSAGLSDVSS